MVDTSVIGTLFPEIEKGAKLLLIAATYAEIAPVADLAGLAGEMHISESPVGIPGSCFDLLITGPGTVATAFHSALALSSGKYLAAVNAGVAGSFNQELEHGAIVMVTKDRFSDFGAESPYGFIPGEKLPFSLLDKPPYVDGWLVPDGQLAVLAPGLKPCKAITSDTVHTSPATIEKIIDIYQPDIETMEGAAFFFVCMKSGVPCLQIRAVSNMAGPRNSANWQLDLAIKELNNFLKSYLFS